MISNKKTPLYLRSCGFTDAPFRLSPDPEFFFPARPHIAAKKVLAYAINNDEGFMVLIGPAGSGKTLTLRMLLQEIGDDKVTAVIVSPLVSPAGLLRLLLAELSIQAGDQEESAVLLKRFQQVLLELAAEQKEVLIIIDEAQNIPIETLEQLRMLSNIETDSKKLLQIILAGQPELDDLLQDPRLGQLRQRIMVWERLRTFTKTETAEYVRFRLARAGRADFTLTKRAGKILYKESQGIPRLINRLMDRALLLAGAAGALRIEGHHLRVAIKTVPPVVTIKQQTLLPSLWQVTIAVAMAAGLLLIGLMTIYMQL